MYLVFDLPPAVEQVFPSAHTVAFLLHREFDKWSDKYQIKYKTKFHKNRLRFILDTDSEYHFFMWSWNPDLTISTRNIDAQWARYEVVSPPKH